MFSSRLLIRVKKDGIEFTNMLTTPTLSIVLIVNVELDPKYISYFLHGLSVFNSAPLENGEVELIIVNQRKDTRETYAALKDFPYRVDVVNARHDFVGNYPIWDILAELRQITPFLNGKYLCVCHPEFLWLPGRLQKTIDWLKSNPEEYLVLGNLRRPGDRVKIEKEHPKHVTTYSEIIMEYLDHSNFEELVHVVEETISCSWMFWSPEPSYGIGVQWMEDIFFISRDFISNARLLWHGGRLPFQDVYDLIGIAVPALEVQGLKPRVSRMDLNTNKVLHLHHPKHWGSWTPAIRDYFLKNKQEWAGTRFLDVHLWNQLIKCTGENMPKNEQPVFQLRRSNGGTVYRYAKALESWLAYEGGKAQVQKFYDLHLQKYEGVA